MEHKPSKSSLYETLSRILIIANKATERSLKVTSDNLQVEEICTSKITHRHISPTRKITSFTIPTRSIRPIRTKISLNSQRMFPVSNFVEILRV